MSTISLFSRARDGLAELVRPQPGAQCRLLWHRLPSEGYTSSCDVVVVTQLSSNRLQRLDRLAVQWGGPLVAAVLLTGPRGQHPASCSASEHPSQARLKQACEELCARAEAIGASLEILLLEWREASADAYYPVNELRNVALARAKAHRFVFQLDVDFIPSAELRASLGDGATLADRLSPPAQLSGVAVVALVVPALEPTDESAVGEIPFKAFSVGAAREWLRSGKVRPMAWAQFPTGHRATDFERWLEGDGGADAWAYGPVAFEEGFEPFVILLGETAPYFDERLCGYGRNKCLQLFHLHAMGCDFQVLRGGCVFHVPHEPSDAFVRTFARGSSGAHDKDKAGRLEQVKAIYRTAKLELLSCGAAPEYGKSQVSSWHQRAARPSKQWAAVDPSADLSLDGLRCLAEQTWSLYGDYRCEGPLGAADVRMGDGPWGIAGASLCPCRSESHSLEVTWSTHCSHDRLERLSALLDQWAGQIACAVLSDIGSAAWNALLREAKSLCDLSGGRLTLSLFRPRKRRSTQGPAVYPANALRNASLELVRTRLVLIADVDLLPSHGLAKALAAETPALLCGQPRFLVLPAVELQDADDNETLSRPNTGLPYGTYTDSNHFVRSQLLASDVSLARDQLRVLCSTGRAISFHASFFPAGHAQTDLRRWLDTSSKDTYCILWAEGYEPYGVAETAKLPLFDVRFDSFFQHDKHSFFAELARAGWEFAVFREGFLLDRPHARTKCSTLARGEPRLQARANGLMRRKFRELRCGDLSVAALRQGAEDWQASLPCCCAKHTAASGATPPFICSNVGPGVAATAAASLERSAASGLPTWVLPPSVIDKYAKQDTGRQCLAWEGNAAELRGRMGLDRFAGGGSVGLGPGEPLQLRVSFDPTLSSLTLRYTVRLDGEAALRRGGRLPGLSMECACDDGVYEIRTAFLWAKGGVGSLGIFLTGSSKLTKRCFRRRPWRLTIPPSPVGQDASHHVSGTHTLEHRVELGIPGRNVLSVWAWVDGRLIWWGEIDLDAIAAGETSIGQDRVWQVCAVNVHVRPEDPDENSESAVWLGPLEIWA